MPETPHPSSSTVELEPRVSVTKSGLAFPEIQSANKGVIFHTTDTFSYSTSTQAEFKGLSETTHLHR